MRARWLALGVLGASLAACGPTTPPLRIAAEAGKTLVYDAHRQDEWADGFGGTLDTQLRFRLETEDAVPGRGARYGVVLESVRIDSPPRFGVQVDTSTPDPEPGDDLGVEDLVRRFLVRRGSISFGVTAIAASVEPDRELRTELKAWKDGKDPQRATPAVMLLDELLDGPRVVARWLQAPGVLLPADPYPARDATWTRSVPPASTPAGKLSCELAVTQEWTSDTRVVLHGKGAFVLVESDPNAPVTFDSGTLTATAVLDTTRGVFVDYDEVTEFVLIRKTDGAESSARWTRTLKLID